MVLKARDMRRKITAALKEKPEAEQIRIIDGFIREWPTNVRGEYVEMRRHLVRRLEKLQNVRGAKGSSARPSADPFVVPKAGHLTAALLGLPNSGKTYVFHRMGGDGATVADYSFSTTSPAVHLVPLDNLSIQVVDLPPITANTMGALPYGRKMATLLTVADVVCVVLDFSQDVESQEVTVSDELDSLGVDTQTVPILVLGNRAPGVAGPDVPESPSVLTGPRLALHSDDDFHDVLPHVARSGGYLSVFTKPPGQSFEEADRLWVERGATIKDLAGAVHRGLAGRTTGARVWGDSSKQPGQSVSTDHVLSDGAVVELRTS